MDAFQVSCESLKGVHGVKVGQARVAILVAERTHTTTVQCKHAQPHVIPKNAKRCTIPQIATDARRKQNTGAERAQALQPWSHFEAADPACAAVLQLDTVQVQSVDCCKLLPISQSEAQNAAR